ncbi:MAG: DUF4832 domain-containing protein [Vicinamibacterales bacterium]
MSLGRRLPLAAALAAVLCMLPARTLLAQEPVITTYRTSTEVLANPERGFYRGKAPLFVGTERQPLDERVLRALRSEGITLVRAYYVLDEFMDAPLPAPTLQAIDADFSTVRRAGVKVIPRFVYSYPCIGALEPCDDAALSGIRTDPGVDRVLAHMDALAPVLRGNADVIAFVEAGFIGAWGEWHHSSSGLLNRDNTPNANSSVLIDRLLWAVPDSRKVALRTPLLKQAFTGPDPLTPAQAHQTTAQARLGQHNDCFLHGPFDGLLQTGYDSKLAWLKKFLHYDNRFVPQGGETCAPPDSEPQQPVPHARCEIALRELEIARYDVINIEYHPAVVDLWRREGCFAEVQNRLGYRFRLVESRIRPGVRGGEPFSGQVTIVNDGWSAPYNPRLAEVVARHQTSGRLVRLAVQGDPRTWMPGEPVTVTFSGTLPLETGAWELFLNLPDPDPRLYANPDFSIRLANEDVWEPATGFNRLLVTVAVTR